MHIKKPKGFLIKLQMEPIYSNLLPSPLLLPLITSTHLCLLFHCLNHYFLAFPTLTPPYRFDVSHFMFSLFNITLSIFQCIVSSTSMTCLRHMHPYAHNPTVGNCSAGPVLPTGYVKHRLSAHLCLSDSPSTPAVWVMSKAALDLGYKSDDATMTSLFQLPLQSPLPLYSDGRECSPSTKQLQCKQGQSSASCHFYLQNILLTNDLFSDLNI